MIDFCPQTPDPPPPTPNPGPPRTYFAVWILDLDMGNTDIWKELKGRESCRWDIICFGYL